MGEQTVTVAVDLPLDHAWAFAQFLKRAGHSDYLRLAKDSDEAYLMLYAGETLRDALTDAGVAPR